MNPSPEDETPEVEESLEDTIRNAMTAANEEPSALDETTVAGAEPVIDESPSRERDEHGRFRARAGEEAPVGDTSEAKPASETAADNGVATPDPYGLAPQYAGPAIKGKWNDLPAEVREEIVKRDREVHQQFTRYDEERNFGKQVKSIVQPYEGLIRSMGAEPTQALEYLLKTDAALRTAAPDQKRAMFMQAARDYGIDLGTPGDPNQQQGDPRLETLQQQIDRLEREQNNASNAARETEQAEIASSIESFASDPAHVYFDRVRLVMSALMSSGQAGNLEEAYDKAVWADPETRALHLAANAETEDRKRTAAAAEQAAKARRASPSVTGAPGSAVPPQNLNGSSNSVEDDVRAALMLHAGRA